MSDTDTEEISVADVLRLALEVFGEKNDTAAGWLEERRTKLGTPQGRYELWVRLQLKKLDNIR